MHMTCLLKNKHYPYHTLYRHESTLLAHQLVKKKSANSFDLLADVGELYILKTIRQ